jgi:selenocysteine lyase/cysteine desulfurase
VIFESHAHPGGSFPWFNQQQLNGAVVKHFDPDPASAAGNLDRIRALITPRTKVIQISHVTAPTGVLFPAAEIAKLAHEHGIWFHIDGAQSAGMFPFSLREIGCDSFATSGHKWIGGPHETGILYVKRDRQDEVVPVEVGAYSGELPYLPGTLTYTQSAVRYEYATRSAAAVLALAEAMHFQEQIGRDRIAARGRALAQRVRDGFNRIPDVEVLTPTAPDLHGSILTFRTPRMSFEKLFGELLEHYQVRSRPVSEQKLNALRISTHLFNTPAEVDRLLTGVEELSKKA